MNDQPELDLISAGEAAKILGCTESNVRAMVARGSLPDHSSPAALRQPRRVMTARAAVEDRLDVPLGRATPVGTISVTEAALRAGVHRTTILGWISDGKLAAEIITASSAWAILPEDLASVVRIPAGRPIAMVEQ